MKKPALLFLILVAGAALLSFSKQDSGYVIIGWNDLGMHCANKDFSKIAILPPYNNIYAQVIKKGDGSTSPGVVTDIAYITYEIPGNTYSVGKTNFWDYAKKLFGVDLAPNIGLKGNGLTGRLTLAGNYFVAEGIPLTPYTDNDTQNEDPFQLILLKAYDANDNEIAETRTVIPVSNEISCVSSGCHNSETEILNAHPQEEGFNAADTPILCAKCHASNALGTAGISEARPLSYRIHNQHSSVTNDCYKCHPGQNTQCLRGAMFAQGKVCTDCHGNMKNVAVTITQQGRRPWLDEPSCGDANCHGMDYATNPGLLYRQSQDHGGLFCSACHGSPHAEVPSTNDRDNVQNIALQGFAGVLKDCKVCHTVVPSQSGPHGIIVGDVKFYQSGYKPEGELSSKAYPNPVNDLVNIEIENNSQGYLTLRVFDNSGKLVIPSEEKYVSGGGSKFVIETANFTPGVYRYEIQNGRKNIDNSFTVVR